MTLTNPSGLSWCVAPQHIMSIAVRARDIDVFNHVNNVVYLRWMADTAWDHSKALGFDFAAYEARDCGFVVTRHEIDYRQAALADDTIHVATWISRNDGRLKLRRRFQMISDTSGQTLAMGMSEFAAMRLSSARAARMHEDYATGYPCHAAAADYFGD
jgi:acyl-CoA thioester hydrolase